MLLNAYLSKSDESEAGPAKVYIEDDVIAILAVLDYNTQCIYSL